MFNKTRQKTNEYLDFIGGKNAEMIGKINKKGEDMDRLTLRWLARAFALVALVIGVLYIASFVIQISQ